MHEAIVYSWLSWNSEIHMHIVSFPRIAWFASLRNDEVVIGKSAGGHFLFMFVMETLKYTCIPSFTSIPCMACKFEK